MQKRIVFCSDGTWSRPGQDTNSDGLADNTNVYKLFSALGGQLDIEVPEPAKEQEKSLFVSGTVAQVAKYLHGVGNSKNPINWLLGGAFGSGVVGCIVRGYTFISRQYEPGDQIVLVGFSRGAYTVRALAGLIVKQGLLAKQRTTDRDDAYRAGAAAWSQYRESTDKDFRRRLRDIPELPDFLFEKKLTEEDFVGVASISAVGVWDTVGSLGLPSFFTDPQHDLFKFADTKLSEKVLHGFHAVARDEQRNDFMPTTWDYPASNVTQLLFAGSHSDVGGGYPQLNGESGLSDVALEWMIQQLKAVGVEFAEIVPPFGPDALGTAHKPWKELPFSLLGHARRKLSGIESHSSIGVRLGQLVVEHPGESPTRYR
jgi:uncharacterized protein (DUF2235 family)